MIASSAVIVTIVGVLMAPISSAQKPGEGLVFPSDQTMNLTLGPDSPVIEGLGRSHTYEVQLHSPPQPAGRRLYVHAGSETLDLVMRIETAAGEILVQDDDGGGGRDPWISIDSGPHERLLISIGCKDDAAQGALSLHLVEAVDPAEILAAIDSLPTGLGEVQRLKASRDMDRARERIRELAQDFLAMDGAATGPEAIERIWEIGVNAWAVEDLETATICLKTVLAFQERTMSPGHARLQQTKGHYGALLAMEGKAIAALPLHRAVYSTLSRDLETDDPQVHWACQNLGATLFALGRYHEARPLFEEVLEARRRQLPEEHLDVQIASANLAALLHEIGDDHAARPLYEKALEVLSRTRPDDDKDLQLARMNLAATLYTLGDNDAALRLQQKVHEVRSRLLPEDHWELQLSRLNYSATLFKAGRLDEARRLQEAVLRVREKRLRRSHPDLLGARWMLALTLRASGSLDEAREMLESSVVVASEAASAGSEPHSLALRRASAFLALTEAQVGQHERAMRRCVSLAEDLGRDLEEAATRTASRELEAHVLGQTRSIDVLLSMAMGVGGIQPTSELQEAVFALMERSRALGVTRMRLGRLLPGDARTIELRQAIQGSSNRIAHIAGTASTDELPEELRAREKIERDLLVHLSERIKEQGLAPEVDAKTIADRLRADEVAVSYRRYMRHRIVPSTGMNRALLPSYLACVVTSDRALTFIDLGPADAIEEAIGSWREAVVGSTDSRGAASRGVEVVSRASPMGVERSIGERLRELIFEPLRSAFDESTRRVTVVPDAAIHLVPWTLCRMVPVSWVTDSSSGGGRHSRS